MINYEAICTGLGIVLGILFGLAWLGMKAPTRISRRPRSNFRE